MKFNSQICTTREQSERLLALGLKKETADCHFEGRKNIHEEWEVAVMGGCYYSYDFPAWSLHRLIEIANLPQYWECISGDWYEEIIATIQSKIHIGELNKEYLEEL